MKLRQEIIARVNNVPSRRTIGTKLNVGDQSIHKALVANLPNGRLTKLDALVAIKEELGIDDIMELVQASDVVAATV